MNFDQMNSMQRRLHNAACVLGADGDEYGFEQLQRDAIEEIERLRAELARCGGNNCMGRRCDDVTNWVTEQAAQARVVAERERCAKICEETGAYTDELEMAQMCAAAIRAS